LRNVFVTGVGMTAFMRPGARQWEYPDMGREAGNEALKDAGLSFSDIQGVVASYCYGEPTCGQRVTQELGLTGVPVFNVNNNCSSGSSALFLARTMVQAGYDCVMAIGFEQMERGLTTRYDDKISPVGTHIDHLHKLGADTVPIPGLNKWTEEVIKMFSYAAREYEKENPGAISANDMGLVAQKNRQHGAANPKAYHQTPVPLEYILDPKYLLSEPITAGMSAPTACGSAAAIVCSEEFVKKHGLQKRAVQILSQHQLSDLPSSFDKSFKDLVGVSLAKEAADRCYRDAGLTSHNVDIVECHDCFSVNELFMYEALGLCQPGKAGQLLRDGKWKENSNGGKLYTLNDKWVVNASGGLESKGHPIGATGLAQCHELVTQLRGEAGKRQVDGAKTAIQHNFGLGSAAVVTLYGKPLTAKL